MSDLSVSFRVDFGPRCSIGPGKISLLESINRTGSLSQAARTLKMSYRRAWLLLEDVNTSFQQAAAQMSVGGRGGGGAALTQFGSELVRAYRALETEIRGQVQKAFPPTAVPAPQAVRGRKPLAKRHVNRSASPAARSSPPGRAGR
ncbi:MAG: winged helix-turn-helix domain-containing protein [Steroidobacteraceae bacterium]